MVTKLAVAATYGSIHSTAGGTFDDRQRLHSYPSMRLEAATSNPGAVAPWTALEMYVT